MLCVERKRVRPRGERERERERETERESKRGESILFHALNYVAGRKGERGTVCMCGVREMEESKIPYPTNHPYRNLFAHVLRVSKYRLSNYHTILLPLFPPFTTDMRIVTEPR